MLWITAIFVFVRTGCAFLFNSPSEIAHCYELDLENCFREAFLAAIHPPIRGKRNAPFFHSANITVLDKRKSGYNDYEMMHIYVLEKRSCVMAEFPDTDGDARHPNGINVLDRSLCSLLFVDSHRSSSSNPSNMMLCHDVRRFSLCFHYPGCSEQVAAAIASVQYHMVFGKKLPLHIFLAYKGYGRQMCEQTCSRDAMLICRRTMTNDEQDQEQTLIMEATTIAQSFGFGSDDSCDNFRRSLAKLVRFRTEFCGDLSRCTCSEARWEAATVRCGFDCNQVWREGLLVQPDMTVAVVVPISTLAVICMLFW